ncbi:Uncharacterized protein HZ326_26051 [Fusarium oxysporum f. sp. albedinis]|nr:Uncharacterized protein HZ326_26051 [Fusarium oxysporum f. sp. albedinis]
MNGMGGGRYYLGRRKLRLKGKAPWESSPNTEVRQIAKAPRINTDPWHPPSPTSTIVVEQDALFDAKAIESCGETNEQSPRHRATIGRHCHRNAKDYPADDASSAGQRTDRPTDRPTEVRKSSSSGSSGSDGRAMLQKALGLLGESRRETKRLQEVLNEQIEATRELKKLLQSRRRQYTRWASTWWRSRNR